MENAVLCEARFGLGCRMIALDQIKECIQARQDFVVQGGAGSGKTETLKEILAHIADSQPSATAACITLTNKAADEIKNRVGDHYHISTIHSFLHSLIDVFRSNIRSVLPIVFLLEPLVVADEGQVQIAHDVYKKKYGKFAALRYRFDKFKFDKVVGKVVYDKDPRKFVATLSNEINSLNESLSAAIALADLSKIRYNESSYNSIRNFSYGHDGLLKVAAALIERYPKLRRVLADRFDFIFVDEYQDTSPSIVGVLIDIIGRSTKATIGLFGDSMQGIYEDGIGDVEKYVASGALRKIEKEDNFRCSQQVIKFLNTLRLDTLRQEVALKARADGTIEHLADRQGGVNLIYAIAPEGAKKDKQTYLLKLKALISKANAAGEAKYLMLTNKSIAGEVGFLELYEIFTERYGQERGDEMERVLSVLQFDELALLCTLHKNKESNELIVRVKKQGYLLNSKSDKERLHSSINLIACSKLSAIETIENAFRYGLLSKSDSFTAFVDYKDEFLDGLKKDGVFQDFIADKAVGVTTALKMTAAGRAMDEYLFEELNRRDKKRIFYEALFSKSAKFSDVLNYYSYLNDEKPYITMHKTKGTGISEVIVVLDEYYWRDYDFKNVLIAGFGAERPMDRKLVYVACSRAVKNLTCVRLISNDEEDALLTAAFTSTQKFDFATL
ncbi:AAA family ATPase [Massilia sp. PAMC28688]|uniref:UvrD-helicase domain-containing protein n=1 Tax=Massilia sp. PAMC28688 TaxID=2861283 RepID=UPI001C62F71E|nr:UvrD-helicase domain-containing protein [Massilia sp. PAMC28688]QYF93252.1 AAA family ATPase [Massilia sp. PAMC28688]